MSTSTIQLYISACSTRGPMSSPTIGVVLVKTFFGRNHVGFDTELERMGRMGVSQGVGSLQTEVRGGQAAAMRLWSPDRRAGKRDTDRQLRVTSWFLMTLPRFPPGSRAGPDVREFMLGFGFARSKLLWLMFLLTSPALANRQP